MPDDRRPDDEDLPEDPLPDLGRTDGEDSGTGDSTSGTGDSGSQRPLGPSSGESSPSAPGSGPIGFGGSGAGGAGGGQNPFEALFAALGQPGQPGQNPDMNAFMQQLQGAFSMLGGQLGGGGTSDGGINWDLTKDTARKTVASLGSDPSPQDRQRREVTEAVSLAETWLDQATEFARAGRTVSAWSRAEWIEKTMPVWQRLIEPVATHIADAMGGALNFGGLGGSDDPAGLPPEMRNLEQMLQPMLRNSGATMFGMQAGQALGQLATEVVGTSDIGLPLAPDGQLALLPANVASFAEGLEQSEADVLLYLALREAARQRLYGSAGWLREQLFALVAEYARGISIDTSALEQAVGEMESGNMEDLAAAFENGGGLFEPQKTPEQQATLERLETLLALVEGWVDDVVGVATERWMPSAGAIAEMVRRRRATGGPAEDTFATLVGLELRPRRLRDAANLWAAVRAERGAEGRDAIWAHPDLIPTSADLDDPIGFATGENRGESGDDFDSALAALLEDSSATDGPAKPSEGDTDRVDDGDKDTGDKDTEGNGGEDNGGEDNDR